jgi:hypothetical protein
VDELTALLLIDRILSELLPDPGAVLAQMWVHKRLRELRQERK